MTPSRCKVMLTSKTVEALGTVDARSPRAGERKEDPVITRPIDEMSTSEALGGGLRPIIPASARDGRHEHALELGVFLFLIVPSMVLSFFTVQQGQVPFPLMA